MPKILVALLISVLMTPTGAFAQIEHRTGTMREAVHRESVRWIVGGFHRLR